MKLQLRPVEFTITWQRRHGRETPHVAGLVSCETGGRLVALPWVCAEMPRTDRSYTLTLETGDQARGLPVRLMEMHARPLPAGTDFTFALGADGAGTRFTLPCPPLEDEPPRGGGFYRLSLEPATM